MADNKEVIQKVTLTRRGLFDLGALIGLLAIEKAINSSDFARGLMSPDYESNLISIGQGSFTTETPNIYLPNTDLPVNFRTSKRDIYQLYGLAHYRFLVGGLGYGQPLETDIEQFLVMTENPFPNTKRNPKLGYRNNRVELMEYVGKGGASRVRIAGNTLKAYDNSVMELLNKATRENLKILYVLNPNKPLDPKNPQDKIDLQNQLKYLFNNYDADLEIGNEPDNQKDHYWQNRDLKSFAEFVRDVIIEARAIKPDCNITVGALDDVSRTKELLSYLKDAGIDISAIRNLSFAVHAYNIVEDVKVKMDVVKGVTGKPVVVTELGVKEQNKKRRMVDLLDEAERQGALAIYVHELGNITGFGYIDEGRKIPDTYFYYILLWSQLNLQ